MMVAINQYAIRTLGDLEHLDLEVSHIETGMLTLRRNEKDFMPRLDMKYPAKLEKNLATMRQHLISSNHPADFKDKINSLLDQYQSRFMTLVASNQEKGLNSNEGQQGPMRNTVHQTEELLTALQEEIEMAIADSTASVNIISIIALIVLAGLIIASMLWLAISILRPVTRLTGTMEEIAAEKVSLRSDLQSQAPSLIHR